MLFIRVTHAATQSVLMDIAVSDDLDLGALLVEVQAQVDLTLVVSAAIEPAACAGRRLNAGDLGINAYGIYNRPRSQHHLRDT